MDLVGNRVRLTPVREEMITEEYVSWLNDPEVNRYLETGRFPVTIDAVRSYVASHRASTSSLMLAIVSAEEQRFIGTITLSKIDPIARVAAVGVMIGNRDYWGKGCGREAVQLLLQYAYGDLNLRKLFLFVVRENPAARLYEKLGFLPVGELKEHVYIAGRYHDLVMMEHFRGDSA